uniref:Polypeptide N-acetylgalactosaminyltransferase n=1 Tax=Anopheles atroparvus TaxID=41427 RepID=A0AAG5D368_ANOAO
MGDDKLQKARRARLRSQFRALLKLLFSLRYPLLITLTVTLVLLLQNHHVHQREAENSSIRLNIPRIPMKIDYHNYEQMQHDLERVGPGEQGKPATLSPEESESELRKTLYFQNGFNALLSDKISINRSVADLRHARCRQLKYIKQLPSASIIVPFYDEHWTTLLRTVYSVLNRSPRSILKEIILVDDGSTKLFLKQQLDEYIKDHLTDQVQIIRLPERNGLIKARLEGAKIAKGDVLIFLDSHVEASTNWLPPLLEPIALDNRTCTCPFIDIIKDDSFEFIPQDEGARGAFDWNMLYKRLPLRPEDLNDPVKPFPSPVMAGGLFAINADFFWKLGGYDEGLEIWGAEQYELSFKIWMCGGRMLDVPCSRVGHIYRSYSPFPNAKTYDFVARNHKRVAEVWMDEFKQFVYDKDRIKYAIDAGDLSKMKRLRKTLMCKSFRWFMEEVAPDLMDWYPPVEPDDFASGTIQSLAKLGLCFEVNNNMIPKQIVLVPCAVNKTVPERNEQYFRFSWRRDIRAMHSTNCVDVSHHFSGAELQLFECHNMQGNQLFQYDVNTKQIYVGKDATYCLDADPIKRKVVLNQCSITNDLQRWQIGQINLEHLQNWKQHGAKLKE